MRRFLGFLLVVLAAAGLALDALEQRAERLGLLLGDARRRLVEQQHVGIVGDRHRQVDDPPRPGRQLGHELVAEGAQVHELDEVVHRPGHVELGLLDRR